MAATARQHSAALEGNGVGEEKMLRGRNAVITLSTVRPIVQPQTRSFNKQLQLIGMDLC